MIDGLVTSSFYGSKSKEKARRLLYFRKSVWLSPIITVSQAKPQEPRGLDIEPEAPSSKPFMERKGLEEKEKESKNTCEALLNEESQRQKEL